MARNETTLTRLERPADIPETLDLQALASMLAERDRGVSGPRSRDQIDAISSTDIEAVVLGIGASLPVQRQNCALTICATVANTYNKLIARSNLYDIVDGSSLAYEIAQKVCTVLGNVPGNYNVSSTFTRALTKLATYHDEAYINYYFSDDFSEDVNNVLYDKDSDGVTLPIREIINTASNNRDPVALIFSAASEARRLHESLQERQLDFSDEQYKVLSQMTRKSLLRMCIKDRNGQLESLKNIADTLLGVRARDVGYFQMNLQLMIEDLTGHSGFDVQEKIDGFLVKAERGRKIGGLGVAGSVANAAGYFVDGDDVGRALKAARVPYATPDKWPRRYKEDIRIIEQSKKFNTSEITDFKSSIQRIQDNILRLYDVWGDSLGAKTHPAILAIKERIADLVHAAKYISENDEEDIHEIKMGSKTINDFISKSDLFRSVRYVEDAISAISEIRINKERDPGAEEENLELGYLDGTNDKVLMLSKQTNAPTIRGLEIGKSARINFIVGLGDTIPSNLVSERAASTLSLRFDYDEGRMVFDIGGKSDYPYSPDYIVAKVISFGAQQRNSDNDYHVEISDISKVGFAQFVNAFRGSVRYSGRALRVQQLQ